MSLAQNHVSTCYPLGGASRRRRMLAIQIASQNQSATPGEAPLAPLSPPSTSPSFSLDRFGAEDPHDGLPDHVGRSERTLTWMFLGEGFLLDCGERDWPGFVELFTAGLRSRRPRSRDTVIDACTSAFRVRDVLAAFGERITRRNPSVLFLLCGPSDPQAGVSALAGFENALLQFARRASEAGILFVLNTSPVPYFTDDHPSVAAHLIYAEAVRSIAAELELPLVDHRLDWEQFAVPPGGPGSWYDADGLAPAAAGHRRIAAKLLSALSGLQCTSSGDVTSLVATSE